MYLRAVIWVAVRRESHHFVFVAVGVEADELRQRRIKNSERMREVNTFVNFHGVAAANSHRCAGEIAEAVDGNTRGFVETRNQEGRSEMREMMFDVMDLRFERNSVRFFKSLVGGRRAPEVTDLLDHQARVGSMG